MTGVTRKYLRIVPEAAGIIFMMFPQLVNVAKTFVLGYTCQMFARHGDCFLVIVFLLSVAASPNLWLKLLKYLKQDPSEFIIQFEENINRVLIEEYNASQVIVSSVPYCS